MKKCCILLAFKLGKQFCFRKQKKGTRARSNKYDSLSMVFFYVLVVNLTTIVVLCNNMLSFLKTLKCFPTNLIVSQNIFSQLNNTDKQHFLLIIRPLKQIFVASNTSFGENIKQHHDFSSGKIMILEKNVGMCASSRVSFLKR